MDGWMDGWICRKSVRVESTWKIPVGRWGRAQQTRLAEWISCLRFVGYRRNAFSAGTHGYEGKEVAVGCATFAPGAAGSFCGGAIFGLLSRSLAYQRRYFRCSSVIFCPLCFDWIVTRRTLHLALTSVESDPMHRRTLHPNENEMPS